jgi:hypothetical protein
MRKDPKKRDPDYAASRVHGFYSSLAGDRRISSQCAFDGAPGVNLPSLGIGINRVPCDAWESQTPVPFVGSIKDLVHLCPGELSVQLYQLQARLVRPGACYYIWWHTSNGTFMGGRHCAVYDKYMGQARRWKFVRWGK